MRETVVDKLYHAWNVFRGREPTVTGGGGSSYQPGRAYISYTGEKSIVSAVYNRMAMDVAALDIEHVKNDEDGNYMETVRSGLHKVLTESANVDQTGRQLIMDAVISMFDEGDIAIVPVETSLNPMMTAGFDITNMRIGRIVRYYPQHVRIDLYDERDGEHKEVTLPKKAVAIIQNPLYEVMNQPNSTLKRLINKIALLDVIDNQTGSGKLDIIIQLPYQVRNERTQERADEMKKNIEMQLSGSKYGIGYVDSSAKIHQLNRPAENNLMAQIEYLTNMLYDQLGLTEGVFKGTASEDEMNNYLTRTVEPIAAAICDELKRKFLSQKARTQGHSIRYFIDPFKFIPTSKLAELIDTTSTNAIMSSNEWRSVLGRKPSKEKIAKELSNKNITTKESAEGAANEPTNIGDVRKLKRKIKGLEQKGA